MSATYLIGLDYGTESARGVLLDAASGDLVASHVHAYRHGVMTARLPGGAALPRGWALQDPSDYLEAAADILGVLGRGRAIESIGVDFTASSPMPAASDGRPLSAGLPDEPHAYVKLWKHGAAQPYADEISRRGGDFLDNFGGRVSGEWMLAKAAQIAREAPGVWDATSRFIESGDWLVWQLTGHEVRSLGFAAYKAQYLSGSGYPREAVPGLAERLAPPVPIGRSAGSLSDLWRARTGIQGPATVAVAVIDSHAVLPAIGAVSAGCFVGALGTSAVYLFLSDRWRPLPAGIEGVARDGSIRGLWCYEAGQAAFGDLLAWFARTFPTSDDPDECFRRYNQAADGIAPGANHLVALDWWSGNRVPHGDSGLSGLILGLNTATTAAHIYRALMESICFGARSVIGLFEAGDLSIGRIILSSGLARSNPLLVQIMADVLDREVDVPQVAHATAVGAAIHGAVAAGLVSGYGEGSARYGARTVNRLAPRPEHAAIYRELYQQYAALAASDAVRRAMHGLNRVAPAGSDRERRPELRKQEMRISGAGCCVVDLLYEVPPGEERLSRWLSRSPGDGGVIRGGAVLKSALERRAGTSVDAWAAEVLSGIVPRRALGGVSIVALIAAAQLLPRETASVRFHACLSDDADGEWIFQQIGRTPVGQEKLRRRRGRCPTTLCLNERHTDGSCERSFLAEPCIPEPLALEVGELDQDFFASDVAVFCCMHWEPKLFGGLTSVLSACKRSGAITVMGTAFDATRGSDHGRWPLGDSDEVYRHVDLLLMDRTEALRYSGERDLGRAQAFFRQSGVGGFAITDGIEPVLYWSSDSLCAASEGALPIPAAIEEDKARGILPTGDTVGCGDNFVGGVAACLATQRHQGKRLDLVKALRVGNLCGGIASTHAGGVFFESRAGEKRELIERYAAPYRAQLGRSSWRAGQK